MYQSITQCTSLYQSLPDCARVYQSILRCTKVYQSILRCTKLYQSVLRRTKVYQSVLRCTKVYQSVLECTKVYQGASGTSLCDIFCYCFETHLICEAEILSGDSTLYTKTDSLILRSIYPSSRVFGTLPQIYIPLLRSFWHLASELCYINHNFLYV